MSAAGKKNTLAMTDPAKPWPFGPATRGGQDATAAQVIANTIHRRASRLLPRSCRTFMHAAGQHRVPAQEQPPVRCPPPRISTAVHIRCRRAAANQGLWSRHQEGLAPGSSGTAVSHRACAHSNSAQAEMPTPTSSTSAAVRAIAGLPGHCQAEHVSTSRSKPGMRWTGRQHFGAGPCGHPRCRPRERRDPGPCGSAGACTRLITEGPLALCPPPGPARPCRGSP